MSTKFRYTSLALLAAMLSTAVSAAETKRTSAARPWWRGPGNAEQLNAAGGSFQLPPRTTCGYGCVAFTSGFTRAAGE